jgi:hypothetical protein
MMYMARSCKINMLSRPALSTDTALQTEATKSSSKFKCTVELRKTCVLVSPAPAQAYGNVMELSISCWWASSKCYVS